jgi:hypothetical protein
MNLAKRQLSYDSREVVIKENKDLPKLADPVRGRPIWLRDLDLQ